MAKQESLVKFKGAIEDLTFFKTRDGYQARRKSGVNAQRILNDPAFQRTRENGLEFGHGGRSAKHLRRAIRSLLLNVSDHRMSSRLTQAMIKVVKSDTTSNRGERNVLGGDLSLLIGFEFNINAQLSNTFFTPFTHSLDREAGTAIVTIGAAQPANALRPPEGATHIRFVAGMTAVDFVSGDAQFTRAESAELDLRAETFEELTLNLSLPAVGELPVFLLMGTEFFQQVNGRFYGLRNGAFNALSLIDVSIAG